MSRKERIMELDLKKYSRFVDDAVKVSHPTIGVIASDADDIIKKVNRRMMINEIKDFWVNSGIGSYEMVTSKKIAAGAEYLRKEYYDAIARLKERRTRFMATDLWRQAQEEQAAYLESQGKNTKENLENSIISEIGKRIWIDAREIVPSPANLDVNGGFIKTKLGEQSALAYLEVNHDSLVAAIAGLNMLLEMNKEYIATGKLPGFIRFEEDEDCDMPDGLKGFLEAMAKGELNVPGIKVIKGEENMLKHMLKERLKNLKAKVEKAKAEEDDDKKIWN